jgi:O-antigen/teichoic acid export membrane protein
MGVIIQQGIKHSLVNYIGAGVGVISMLFIYPLHTEAYGLARFLTDSAILFIPLSLLGSNVLPVRFFPAFEDRPSGHHGFLGWLLLIALVGAVLTVILAWVFWDPVISYYSTVSPLYEQFLIYFIPILILRGVIQLLISYTSNFHRIVIPSLLNDLLLKISLPIFILLVYTGRWDVKSLVIGLVLNFGFVLLGLIIYLVHLGQWSLKVDWPAYRGPVMREMKEYGFYGFLGTISSTIAVNIDLFMIGTMISPTATGVYGIASIMANLINRPHVAISTIAAPIMMKAWQQGNREEIARIYRKSAVNGLAPGILIFLLIWLNLGNVYQIMPNSEVIAENRTAIFLLGMAFIVNLATGVNSEVMIYSSLFKAHFWAVVFFFLTHTVLNYWLIGRMGITGAALGTLIAYVVYNAFKCGAILVRFGMHPFGGGMLRLILLSAAVFLIFQFLPLTGSAWPDLFLRSALIGVVYVWLLYRLKVSEDMGQLIRKGLITLGFRFR